MVPDTQLTHGSSGHFFLWTTEAAKQGAVVVILAPNQEDIQTLIIASAKPGIPQFLIQTYYSAFSALGLCTAWCPQVQSLLLDCVKLRRWMRTGLPGILCIDFDPTSLLSASCLSCLMQHLVLSSSEWLGGLLDTLARFSKISGEGNSYPLQYSGLENSMEKSMGSQIVRHSGVTFTIHVYTGKYRGLEVGRKFWS